MVPGVAVEVEAVGAGARVAMLAVEGGEMPRRRDEELEGV